MKTQKAANQFQEIASHKCTQAQSIYKRGKESAITNTSDPFEELLERSEQARNEDWKSA